MEISGINKSRHVGNSQLCTLPGCGRMDVGIPQPRPICSRALARRCEIWGIRIDLVCLRGKCLLMCSWQIWDVNYRGAEHGSAGIHSSPHHVPALTAAGPILEDSLHPQELWESPSQEVPGSVYSLNPSVGLSAALRSSWDPGKPKALSFPGISCFPQRMGFLWGGTGWAQGGTGDPQDLLPPPLPKVLEQQSARAWGIAGKFPSRGKSPIFPPLLVEMKPELEPLRRAEPPSPLPPE